ncbi:MAG: hypothetical protein NZM04_00410 [Methylacidiphilales bacterium]|nr:hypothetical protein [Candidatus Methylacidiphilales bacterium]
MFILGIEDLEIRQGQYARVGAGWFRRSAMWYEQRTAAVAACQRLLDAGFNVLLIQESPSCYRIWFPVDGLPAAPEPAPAEEQGNKVVKRFRGQVYS